MECDGVDDRDTDELTDMETDSVADMVADTDSVPLELDPILRDADGDDVTDGSCTVKSTALLAIVGALALLLNVLPDLDIAHTTFDGSVDDICACVDTPSSADRLKVSTVFPPDCTHPMFVPPPTDDATMPENRYDNTS